MRLVSCIHCFVKCKATAAATAASSNPVVLVPRHCRDCNMSQRSCCCRFLGKVVEGGHFRVENTFPLETAEAGLDFARHMHVCLPARVIDYACRPSNMRCGRHWLTRLLRCSRGSKPSASCRVVGFQIVREIVSLETESGVKVEGSEISGCRDARKGGRESSETSPLLW